MIEAHPATITPATASHRRALELVPAPHGDCRLPARANCGSPRISPACRSMPCCREPGRRARPSSPQWTTPAVPSSPATSAPPARASRPAWASMPRSPWCRDCASRNAGFRGGSGAARSPRALGTAVHAGRQPRAALRGARRGARQPRSVRRRHGALAACACGPFGERLAGIARARADAARRALARAR